MREHIYRAQRGDNKEWVYGWFFEAYGKSFILQKTAEFEHSYLFDYTIEIIPETVGQYTGLTDKNGKKIFEGDIVEVKDQLNWDNNNIFNGVVSFSNGSFIIVTDLCNHYRWIDYDVEIIGNIFDSPELLGGDDK